VPQASLLVILSLQLALGKVVLVATQPLLLVPHHLQSILAELCLSLVVPGRLEVL
jgi:hypothetical protein